MVSLVIVALFYTMAMAADFLATTDPQATDARTSYIAPQPIHFFEDGAWHPYINGLKGVRDPQTFKLIYTIDPSRRVYLTFFAPGYRYDFLGIETDTHLIGLANPQRGDGIFLLGTDLLGRDLWSRLMVATRVSLTIGLVGVTMSLFLGVLLGGISAIYGGWVDTIIQRLIEVIRSMPTIPLWLGLAAALPNGWSVLQVYFAITIIISLLGLDRPRPRRPRQVPQPARGGVRDGGRAGRRVARPHHLPPHAAELRQPHHRRRQPRACPR